MDKNSTPDPNKPKSVVILNKDNGEKIEMEANEFLKAIKDIPPGGQKHG
jgi:hypothetical protein